MLKGIGNMGIYEEALAKHEQWGGKIEVVSRVEVKDRQALSLALDREAIAKAVVYAKAATGLISSGVRPQRTFR